MILTHYKGINLLIKLLDDLFNFVCLYIVERNTLLNTLFLCYIKGVVSLKISFFSSSYKLYAIDLVVVKPMTMRLFQKPTVVNRK